MCRVCLSKCYTFFKLSQRYTHVTKTYRTLTTRQHPQLLIKSVSLTEPWKKQPLGWEGTTSSVCTPESAPCTCPHIYIRIQRWVREEAEGGQCNQWITLHIQTSFYRQQSGSSLCTTSTLWWPGTVGNFQTICGGIQFVCCHTADISISQLQSLTYNCIKQIITQAVAKIVTL